MMMLCNPKFKVLMKEQAKKPVFGEDEKITVNPAFASNSNRLTDFFGFKELIASSFASGVR